MPTLDSYLTDVLMRDLVGHDRKAVGFLVYLWLAAQQARLHAEVRVSYQEWPNRWESPRARRSRPLDGWSGESC